MLETSRQIENGAGGKREWACMSIHHNSWGDPDISGAESYVFAFDGRRATNGAVALAWLLQEHILVNTNRRDRGVKAKGFTVIGGEVPAVLTEPAFLSNPFEERLLREEWFREKEALALASAIREFCNLGRRL